MKKSLILLLFGFPIMLSAQYSMLSSGNRASVKLPNLTSAQILGIANPAFGSITYDISSNSLKFFNGSTWKNSWEGISATIINQPDPSTKAISILPNENGHIELPQLSFNEIQSIIQPQEGSMVYDKTSGCIRYFNGEIWRCTNQWNFNYPEEITAWKPISDNSLSGKIAVDTEGNVIMAGAFTNFISFGNTTLTGSINSQIYCVKYSPTGSVIWAKSFTSSNSGGAENIVIDTQNNIYLAGSFSSNITFDSYTINGSATNNKFIVKLNSEGTTVWANHLSANGTLFLQSVTLDPTNQVILTGYFNTGNLYLNTNQIILSPGSSYTGFISKSNSQTGNFEWGKSLPTSSESSFSSSTTDPDGNIYVTGMFSGNMSLPDATNLSSAGLYDVFVMKYTSDGTFQWCIKEGGTKQEIGKSIRHSGGKLLLVASTNGTTNFGDINLVNNYPNTNEIIYGRLDVLSKTWDWVKKTDGFANSNDVFLSSDNKFYIIGNLINYQTHFSNKSVSGNIGAHFLMRGNFINGESEYIKKFVGPTTNFSQILPYSNNKKIISGSINTNTIFGNVTLSNPYNVYNSFIGIISE